MSKMSSLTRQAFASVLILFLSACAEEPLGGNDQTGKGSYTVTLRLAATVVPRSETKAIAIPAHPGSEAEAVGFYTEMVSSDADRAVTTPGLGMKPMPVEKDSAEINFTTKALATKAPKTLKNVYAFLFTSDGAFNGRAPIGEFTVGTPQDITFTEVANPTATSCRLVMVANDHAAAIDYNSSTDFGTFSGTYADFQKLTIKNEIKEDKDVPYAGSVPVDLSQSEIGATADVTLSWTLAKITLKNPMFNITGGPARNSITLYNAGVCRFAPDTNNNYNGEGSTQTIDVVSSIDGRNADSVTWYVGENIQSPVASIKTSADRNSSKAPKNACYIRIASTAQSAVNKSPQIGEEYIGSGTKSFTYDYYLGNSSMLTDFALRRHTDYTVNTEISGTLAIQEEIATRDGRVTLTRPVSAGLAIGMLGSGTSSNYTTGTGTAVSITGSYSKMLLLEPNTSGTTAADNVTRPWSANESTKYQSETRKYWDPTYTSIRMDPAAGFAYAYCHSLTLGGVTPGTWYLPTQAQSIAMWAVFRGLQGNRLFASYSAFTSNFYWHSTETYPNVSNLFFGDGGVYFAQKTNTYKVRCVREV